MTKIRHFPSFWQVRSQRRRSYISGTQESQALSHSVLAPFWAGMPREPSFSKISFTKLPQKTIGGGVSGRGYRSKGPGLRRWLHKVFSLQSQRPEFYPQKQLKKKKGSAQWSPVCNLSPEEAKILGSAGQLPSPPYLVHSTPQWTRLQSYSLSITNTWAPTRTWNTHMCSCFY